jgi:hypothetical protein
MCTNLSEEPATSISNAGYSTPMMEAADSSETSVYCHYTTEDHIPDDWIFTVTAMKT